MIENAIELVIPNSDAQFYLRRLVHLNEVQAHLIAEPVPFGYWGEVPLYPKDEKHGVIPGLMWGLSHAVFSSYTALVELGYEVEAKSILNFKNHEKV